MQPQAIDSVDTWLLETLDDHRSGAVTWFTRHLMTIGHTAPGVIACCVIALIIVVALRLWRPAVATVIALLIAGRTADLLKHLIDRPRPSASMAIVPAYGYSMPSSVAAASSAAAVAFFIAVIWPSPTWRRAAGTALVVALIVIGLSMVYLGAHWASDVLAGWVLGSTVGLVVGLMVREKPKVSVPSA